MRRFLGIVALYAIVMFTLHVWLDNPRWAMNVQAAAGTYYIDNSATGCGGSGCSNSNNGTSQATAWKSHPYMQQGAGCGGAAHSYTPVAGDKFIFKGGDTWPAACFDMSIPTGGNSSVSNYYGVCVSNSDFASEANLPKNATNSSPCASGTSWPSSGWTRPLFDMGGNVPTGRHVIVATSAFPGYTTFDNIEIANQQLVMDGTGSTDDAYNFASVSGSMPGVLIENGYIHAWFTNANVSALAVAPPYGSGAIDDEHDRVTADHMTVEDSAGWLFAGATKKFGGISGACKNCKTVSNSVWHDVWAICFTVVTCHDNEFYNVSQVLANCVGSSSCSPNSINPHTQVIEDDQGSGATQGGFLVAYNNWIHDNSGAGVTIYVPYNSWVFNNVMSNNANGNILVTWPANDSTSNIGYIYNNTVDCSNGPACTASDNKKNMLGTLVVQNNLYITNGNATCFATSTCKTVATITTLGSGGKNYTMGVTEANNFGFTKVAKYKPSSSDSNVSGKAFNLTSSCSGNLTQLCLDTSGAPWFGGSYITRPTGTTSWDIGAYMGQGGVPGPPSVAITSPSAGTVSGSSVTLTMTCTPQSPSTVSSMQFTIDGFSFGAAGTSSPYSLTWDSTTASNANHVIGGTCTDSRAQVGTAGTVTVAVNNSIPGCFVSQDNDGGLLSWGATQSITAQTTGSVAYTVTVTPNTNNQDGILAGSNAAMTAYSNGMWLVQFGSAGNILAYKGSIGGYTADNAAPYTAGTTYHLTITVDITNGLYSVSETSPSSIAIATNYSFRSTADASQFATINAISDNDTPDTIKVCNFAPPSSTTLTLSPTTLAFGNVTTSTNSTLTTNASATGGTVTFSSIALDPSTDASFTISSDGCSPSTSTNCNVSVKFAPTTTGLKTGTLVYTDSATGSPHSVPLSGTGIVSTATVTLSTNVSNPVTSVQFNSTQINFPGSSVVITATVLNGPATISVSLTGGDAHDWAILSDGCTGSITSSCQEVIGYAPHRFGSEQTTAAFAITGQSTQNVTLVGTSVVSTQVIAVPF